MDASNDDTPAVADAPAGADPTSTVGNDEFNTADMSVTAGVSLMNDSVLAADSDLATASVSPADPTLTVGSASTTYFASVTGPVSTTAAVAGMPNDSLDRIREIVCRYPPQRRHALAAMQDMQREFDYLPRSGLELLARHLGCPLVQLYSMATFYKALSLKPKGKHIIRVCDGTACHIKGSLNLLDGVERVLAIGPGDVTPDGQFSLETVNCLGSCALAPVLFIDDTHFGKVALARLPEIIDSYRPGGERDA